MTLIVISGRLGVGKSTVQGALAAQHRVPIVETATTRLVSAGELGVRHLSSAEFRSAVTSDELCAPLFFGGHWYGWPRELVFRAGSSPGVHASVTARPYTALLLGSMLPFCRVVLLVAEYEELVRRRNARSAIRDVDSTALARLSSDEREFDIYAGLFTTHIRSDSSAPDQIMSAIQ